MHKLICMSCFRPEDSEENPESQEVIDEQVVRQMTREYLEFLGKLHGSVLSRYLCIMKSFAKREHTFG